MGVTALVVMVVVIVMVVTAAFKTVVGAVALVGWDLIDRLEVVGVVMEAVGDIVVLLIIVFFALQQHEQCVEGCHHYRILWRINLKHHNF